MASVVIVGGGFCGVAAAKVLLRSGFSVVLVEPRGAFEFTPGIYRCLSGTSGSSFAVPYGFLKGVRVVRGSVSSVGEGFVLVGRERLEFDYLVISSGAFNPVPKGAGCLVLKRLSDADAIRSAVASSGDVVVCGGGQVGVEVAAMLARVGKKVTVLHAANRLIERCPSKAGNSASRILRGLGVSVKLGEKVVGVRRGVVRAESGKSYSGVVLWCVGIRAALSFVPKGLLAEQDGILSLPVNDSLQTRNSRIFAGGDAADAKVEKTAQNAQIQGTIIGRNILRHSKGLPLLRYSGRQTPMVIDLGSSGIFVNGNFVFSGLPVVWLKRLVEAFELFRLRWL